MLTFAATLQQFNVSTIQRFNNSTMKYTIENITSIIDAHRHGTHDASVAFLLTDSRSLCFPEETLFFALSSARNDGHRYIPELYKRGVRNFVVTQWTDSLSNYPDANFLVVTDARRALQQLAKHHREKFNVPVIGITGSNGKTMAKEWLYQILSRLNTSTIQQFNNSAPQQSRHHPFSPQL